MNELDNEKLMLQLNELKKENKDIVDKTKQQIIQKENIPLILVTLFVFHLDISGNEFNDSQ